MVTESEIRGMAQSENVFDRKNALHELRKNFKAFTDRDQATKDLLALTEDKKNSVRRDAVYALGSVFVHFIDKNQAWNVLLALTKDKHRDVRRGAAEALGSAYPHVTNKNQAWKDMLALTNDKNWDVRSYVAEVLGSAYPHTTDRDQATKDLLALTEDENWGVRSGVAYALGSVYIYVTDKDKVTKALLALTKDEESYVRRSAAEALGSAYPHVIDKNQTTKALLILAKDKESYVREYANHSLGRIHVFKATEAEKIEDFKKELEKALDFFEKSSREEFFSNPARFCFPFYKSFYAITFEKNNAETKVQEYLNEAKNAIEGSESKKKLLEAVENLGNALKEVQNLREKDFDTAKCNLNAYRRYCERAAEMLEGAEEKTPGAVRLVRRVRPIIDEKIKQILAEIQEKAKTLCKQTQGTPFADIGIRINRVGEALSHVRDPIALDKAIGNMQIVLSAICAKMPEEEKGEACELLKKAKDEPYVEDRINLTNMVLSKISSNIGRIIIYTEELNMVKKIQVTGGTGITAGGDVTFGDVSGQVAIGQNITQTQTLSAFDKKELLDSLLGFQKEIAGLGLPVDDLSTVNGDVAAAIKEAKKEEPDASKIKNMVEDAIETIKDAGDFIEKVSKWEWTGKILKILGKLSLSILL